MKHVFRLSVVSLLLVTLFTAGAISSFADDPPENGKSVISLKASPKTVKAGKAVLLKGKLKWASNGVPVTSATVSIVANGKVIKKVKTNSGGVFSSKHKPKKTTIYQAKFAGDISRELEGCSSKKVKVTVKKAKKKK